jgi:hypothetical protein
LEEDLFPLFKDEGAVAVYQASELAPGVTLMLDVSGEEEKARNVINRLGALLQVGGGGVVRKLRIEGVEVTHLRLEEGIQVFLGVADGRLIASSTRLGFEDALDPDQSLADDASFEQAREAAEIPDENLGFVYLDLNRLLSFVLDLDALGRGGDVDPELRANIEPLESALLYGERDGNRVLMSGFVTIK